MSKILKTYKTTNRLFVTVFCVIVFAYTMAMNMQGIGMQDEGWALTAYQQIFSHPSSVSYNFLYYNSILVGGVWESLFGQYGILAFRILYAITEVLKAIVILAILKPYVSRWGIVIGYMSALCMQTWFTSFNNYDISILLSLIAIYCIVQALTKERLLYMVIAGIIVGVNIFSRLTNVAMFGLILVVYYYAIQTKNVGLSIRMFLFAILGVFVGCLIECCVLVALGHWDIFMATLTDGFAASADGDSTHNLTGLLYMYFKHTKQILILTMILVAFPAIKTWLKLQNRVPMHLWILVVFYLCVLTILFFILKSPEARPAMVLAIPMALICVYLSFCEKQELGYVCILCLLYIFLQPFGFDWGMLGLARELSKFGLALSCGLLVTYTGGNKLFSKSLAGIVIFSLCTLLYYYQRSAAQTTGEQNGSRWEMKYKVSSPLCTVYTNQLSCDLLNPLLEELSKYVSEDDELLCFQALALIHYFTHTQPYLNNAWPKTYTSSSMERHFLLSRTKPLPVIVREKSWSVTKWTVPDNDHWDNANAIEERSHSNKKIKLIQSFIQNNGYIVVWENEVFQILVPKEKYKKEYK